MATALRRLFQLISKRRCTKQVKAGLACSNAPRETFKDLTDIAIIVPACNLLCKSLSNLIVLFALHATHPVFSGLHLVSCSKPSEAGGYCPACTWFHAACLGKLVRIVQLALAAVRSRALWRMAIH